MKINRNVSPTPDLAAHAARQLSTLQAELTGAGAIPPADPAPAPDAPEKKPPRAAKSKRPWENVDPAGHIGNTIKIPLPLYEKILWMKDNVPGRDRSIQKITIAALEHWADLQIKKHWKDD